MTFLQILWFCLIFVLIIGYYVLDGFDLGIGILSRRLKGDEQGRAVLRRAVGPVWDGNEVWLLTAGGALFAAFPPAYATSFSGFYLAIMLVLFGLIIRAVSLEFRAHDPEHAKGWDIGFYLGSLIPALLFGVALGNILEGVPLNAHGDYIGGFFALLNPFALVCGVLGLVQCIAQGGAWVAVKSGDEGLRQWGGDTRKTAQIWVLVLFVLATILYFAGGHPMMSGGFPAFLRVVFVALIVLGVLASMKLGGGVCKNDLGSFIASSLVCVGLVGLVGASLFPMIIPATDPMLSITVMNAASSQTALAAMTAITCIGLPLVLIYHVLVYRTFSGRIQTSDLGY